MIKMSYLEPHDPRLELYGCHRSRPRTAPDGSDRPQSYVSLRPDQQPHDPRRPFPHQRAAWERLDDHREMSLRTGIFEGMLVMPTGGGKTLTAVTWVMKNIVNDGGR